FLNKRQTVSKGVAVPKEDRSSALSRPLFLSLFFYLRTRVTRLISLAALSWMGERLGFAPLSCVQERESFASLYEKRKAQSLCVFPHFSPLWTARLLRKQESFLPCPERGARGTRAG